MTRSISDRNDHSRTVISLSRTADQYIQTLPISLCKV